MMPARVTFRGDPVKCRQNIRYGKAELDRTRALRDKMGVPTVQRYSPIDESIGAYVQTICSGDLEIVNIVHPYVDNPLPEVGPVEIEDAAPTYRGALFSGLTARNYKFISSFNPTSETRRAYPENFVAGSKYDNEGRLAIDPHPDIEITSGNFPTGPDYYTNNHTQANLVHACQYSGPIAEIVSVLLGVGNFDMTGSQRVQLLDGQEHSWYRSYVNSNGFAIQYDFKFNRMHQVLWIQGEWWILELSVTNGIIARRLPMLTVNFPDIDPLSTAGAFLRKFGGLPSGESFPDNRAEILTGISEGWITEIMTPGTYTSSFLQDQNEYSSLNAWTFNETATEARTTSYENDTNGWHVNNYWQLVLGGFSASINKLGSGICAASGDASGPDNGFLEVYYYRPEATQRQSLQTVQLPGFDATWNTVPITMNEVVWVGRINSEWSEIYYRKAKIGRWDSTSHQIGNTDITATEFASGYRNTWASQLTVERYDHPYSTEYDWGASYVYDDATHKFNKGWYSRPVTGIVVNQKGDTNNLTQWTVAKYSALQVDTQSADGTTKPSAFSKFYTNVWNRNVYMVDSRETTARYTNQWKKERRWYWWAHKYAYYGGGCDTGFAPAFSSGQEGLPDTSPVLTGSHPFDFNFTGSGSDSEEHTDCGPESPPCPVTFTYSSLANSTDIELAIPGYNDTWATACESRPVAEYQTGVAGLQLHGFVATTLGDGMDVGKLLIDGMVPIVANNFKVTTIRGEVKVIGHKVPDGEFVVYEYEYDTGETAATPVASTNATYTAWMQTPVLGTDALVYSDFPNQEGSSVTTYRCDMLSTGIMPSMPDETDLESKFWYTCTFVGVNGSSDP